MFTCHLSLTNVGTTYHLPLITYHFHVRFHVDSQGIKAVKLGAMLAGKGKDRGKGPRKSGQDGGATSGGGGGPAGGRASPSGSSTSSFVAGYDAAAAANRQAAPQSQRAPPQDPMDGIEEDDYGGDDRYLGTGHNGPIAQYLGDGTDDPRARPNSSGAPARPIRRGGGFGGAGRMGEGGDDVDVRGGGYYDPNEIGGKQRGGFSMGNRVAWKPAGSPGGDPSLGQYIPGHSPAQHVALTAHGGGGPAFSQQGRFGVNESSGYGQASPGWERSQAPPGMYPEADANKMKAVFRPVGPVESAWARASNTGRVPTPVQPSTEGVPSTAEAVASSGQPRGSNHGPVLLLPKVSGAGSIHVLYCCDVLLLPMASCCSQCLLLVVRRSKHT